MNKKVLTVALMAVLGTMAVGCQKEMFVDPQSSLEEASTDYTVRYTVNGVMHTAMPKSEEEYDALLMRLVILTRSGYEVEVSDDNYVPSALATKETLEYKTPNEADAFNWTKQKSREGYKVRMVYDEKKCEHICIATR